jgi:hypothetical protein
MEVPPSGRTKTIKAIFKGEDGSKGFKHGMQYTLIISQKDNILITESRGTMFCHYQSVVALLNNWDVITVLK